jgi:hypothetical protein
VNPTPGRRSDPAWDRAVLWASQHLTEPEKQTAHVESLAALLVEAEERGRARERL